MAFCQSIFQGMVEYEMMVMGFVMVAPTYGRMEEERSGRKRAVEESRDVKRYGV